MKNANNNVIAKTNTTYTLLNELERAITKFFYRRNVNGLRAQEHQYTCTRVGLQVPLWLWTHYDNNVNAVSHNPQNTLLSSTPSTTLSSPLKERTEIKKIIHLIEWLYRNNVSPLDIAVLLPLHWKSVFRQELGRYVSKRNYGSASTNTEESTNNIERKTSNLNDRDERDNNCQGENNSNDSNNESKIIENSYVEEVQLPFIFAHHELHVMSLRGHCTSSYKVVLYMVGIQPRIHELQDGLRQETFIAHALTAASECFIICADAGLSSPVCAKIWPRWAEFVHKLADERPSIPYVRQSISNSNKNNNNISNNNNNNSNDNDNKVASTFPGLVGSFIPLCCGIHSEHRQLESGLTPIIATCPRYCLRPYDCDSNSFNDDSNNNNKNSDSNNNIELKGRACHVCVSLCHPRATHTLCPYSCERKLACHHECLNLCSERCNCFHVIDVPLKCSHERLIGARKVNPTMETSSQIWGELIPIYRKVSHVFRGVCVDAHTPCEVHFISSCARCHAEINITCREALEHHHTREEPTLLCSVCKQRAKELRASLLGEMLVHSERTRHFLRKELQHSSYEEKKGAAHGLFRPGTLVRIIDPTECMPPLEPDTFPSSIKFIDLYNDDSNGTMESLKNAQGTIISSHVNVMDRSELQYLTRLANGSHVLVNESGLQMIRVITTTTTANALASANKRITGNETNGPNSTKQFTSTTTSSSSLSSEALLLLEDNRTNRNKEIKLEEEHQSKQDRDQNSEVTNERMKSAEKLIGQTCYLFASVPCVDLESGVIVDKMVQVQSVDSTIPGNVLVACTLLSIFVNYSASEKEEISPSNACHNNDSNSSNNNENIECSSNVDSNTEHTCSTCYKRVRYEEEQVVRNGIISSDTDNNNSNNNNCNSNCESVEMSIASPCEAERREMGVAFDGGMTEVNYKTEALPLTFSVPIDNLENMQSVYFGKQVCIEEPEQQLTDTHDLELVEYMLRAMSLEFLPECYTLSSTLLDTNNSYSLCGIVNAPLNLHNGLCGPLAILSAINCNNEKLQRHSGPRENKEQLEQEKELFHLFVIPYISIRPDVLADAEAELDSNAQELFAKRLSEAVACDAVKRRQQHDEEFYQVLLHELPRIDESNHKESELPCDASNTTIQNDNNVNDDVEVAFSIPHPLPTKEEVATARNRFLRTPRANATTLSKYRVQDKIIAKKQEMQWSSWVKEMHNTLSADKHANAAYMKKLQLEWHLFNKHPREHFEN